MVGLSDLYAIDPAQRATRIGGSHGLASDDAAVWLAALCGGGLGTVRRVTVTSPATVRQAAVVVSLEAAALVAVAAVVVARQLAGAEDQPWLSGYGTAGWFVVMGSAVLAAGWALWTGRRWGRGIAVFAQLLLLPVAWYMAVGSHQWLYGIPVALVAVATLALLFSPSALQWLSSDDSSASADNSGPDTR